MTRDEATALIRPAVAGRAGDRVDPGAGSGTFTAALAHLPGAPHTVTAGERDVAALAELRQLATSRPRAGQTPRTSGRPTSHPKRRRVTTARCCAVLRR